MQRVTSRLGYRPWLTGLRGIAVSCVILFHLGNIVYGREQSGYVGLRQGYLGVDIFFVLSGFLITTLLLEEWSSNGRISLKAFYLRRILRLLPALLVLLGVTILFVSFTSPSRNGQTILAALASIGYASNWLIAYRGYPEDQILSHTWSLAIEEQFYIIWPLLLIGLLKAGLKQRTIIVLLGVIVTAVLIYRVTMFRLNVPLVRLYNGTDTRADSLLIGCLTAMLVSWGLVPANPRFQKVLGIAAFISAIGVGIYLTGYNPGPVLGWGLTIYAIGVSVIMVHLLSCPSRVVLKLLESAVIVWLGKLSYSLYLWHLLAITLAMSWRAPKPLIAVSAVVLALILAALSYYVIERPFLELKERV